MIRAIVSSYSPCCGGPSHLLAVAAAIAFLTVSMLLVAIASLMNLMVSLFLACCRHRRPMSQALARR